jgi:hypothetical protein
MTRLNVAGEWYSFGSEVRGRGSDQVKTGKVPKFCKVSMAKLFA